MTNTRPIRIFRVNTGSCGGCDAEIEAAVAAGQLVWAASPAQADVILLTGPNLPSARPAFDAVLAQTGDQVPLVAIGRCAIDGRPFGRGGLAERPEIDARLKLDGCPPAPEKIVEALRNVMRQAGR
ncbi:MAG: hypothetical protein RLZZ387_2479 [Chloroflexota bacterium]|jgi:Ni,Fe-hydrogenase III small subunit